MGFAFLEAKSLV